MPSNEHKERQSCYANIDKVLSKGLPEEGMPKDELIRQCQIKFAVPEQSIERFIDRYIALGYVINEDGILTKGGK